MGTPTVIPGQTGIPLSPEDGRSKGSAEYDVRVAGLPDGGFVAIWLDFLPKNASQAISAYPAADGYDADEGRTVMVRRFDADGNAIGPARPVSLDFTGDAGGLGIVTLTDGKVAIGWTAMVADPDGTGPLTGSSKLVAAIYDPATGAASPVTINGAALSEGLEFHQVVALSGGKAGVLYFDRAGTDRLLLTVLNADGSQGATVTLLTNSPGNPWPPAIGMVDGAVALKGANADVIALVTSTFSGSGQTDAIRFFDLDGTAATLPSFTLTGTEGFNPVIEALPNGGVAIAYPVSVAANSFAMRVYRLDAAGAEVGTATDVTFPYGYFGANDLLALPDGGLVVAVSAIGPSFNFGTYAQRLTSAGALDGGIFSLDGGLSGEQSRPQLAMAGSDMVAGWFDAGNMFDFIVRASRFALETGQSLPGTTGADTLVGGDAADTILGGDAGDLLRGAGGADTISGGAGADTLDGGAGADTLRGGLGRDLLNGGEANDRLEGEDGADSLAGAAGADTLLGGLAADTLDGGAGNDLVQAGAATDRILWSMADGGADTVDGGTEFDTLVAQGTAGNDAIAFALASPAASVFTFDAGAKGLLRLTNVEAIEIRGEAGADRIGFTGDPLSGLPRLVFDLGGGADSFQGSGTLGTSVVGGGGNDTIGGGGGADSVAGGDANDLLRGGAGADSLKGDNGNDSLAGEAGADTLLGGIGLDTLDGGADNDRLFGEGGADLLRGGGGDDDLAGGGGADTLTGSPGADTLAGGTEADRFRFASLAEIAGDRVTDFVAGLDKLDFGALDAFAAGGRQPYAFIGTAVFDGGTTKAQIRYETDAGQNATFVQIDSADADATANVVLRLDGVLTLGAGDFIL